jgi:hypothetical protein
MQQTSAHSILHINFMNDINLLSPCPLQEYDSCCPNEFKHRIASSWMIVSPKSEPTISCVPQYSQIASFVCMFCSSCLHASALVKAKDNGEVLLTWQGVVTCMKSTWVHLLIIQAGYCRIIRLAYTKRYFSSEYQQYHRSKPALGKYGHWPFCAHGPRSQVWLG